MTIAKTVWPPETLIAPDMKRIKSGRMPAHLMKAHSLKAWGYRTGTHKGEYEGGFDEWCPAMAVYLMGDIRGTVALVKLILKRIGWLDPEPTRREPIWPELTIEVENAVDCIIYEQELRGVRFDVEKAVALSKHLRNEQMRIEERLKETFGSWWQPLDDPKVGREAPTSFNRKLTEFPDITLRRTSPKTGKALRPYFGPPIEEVTKGSRSVRIEWTEFNPSSRDHLGLRLQAVYGWKPKAYGANGKPTVDEGTLEEIPDSVMPADVRQLILDYFVVSKTLGTLSKGSRAWLTMASGPVNSAPWHVAGRIHGQMDTCGAVTRRGTHKNPNLSGTPAIIMEKDEAGVEHPVKGLAGRYGYECRELFIPDEGEEQTGIDASALELIDLGHFLAPLDGGAFRDRVCDPSRDPHREHAEITGMTRRDTKTATYLKIYGGSAWKLSLDVTVTDEEIPSLLSYKGMHGLLKGLAMRFDDEFVRKLDDRQKARLAKARKIIVALEAGIVGLKDLITDVQRVAEQGWLKAMDGSRIHIRKPYAALNSLLQSAGAISCKLWMVLLHQEMRARGYVHGVDYKQVLWVHDELQFSHRPGLGPVLKEVAEDAIVRAGEMLGLRGRYRTDGKTGPNWAACH